MSIPQDNPTAPTDWKKRFDEEQNYGNPIPIDSPPSSPPPYINVLLSLNEMAADFVIGLFTLGIGILTGIGLAHKMEEVSNVE